MNNKQIDYILELAGTQNFNRAAENLYISQATLSYQIKEVEKEIGFLLFNRSGKGAFLTPAGEQFCASLRTIKEEMRQAIEQAQNMSRKYSDNITIGIPTRSCLYFLPEAIKKFSEIYPEISITPIFNGFYRPDEFLKGNQDIYFTFDNEMKHVPDTKLIPLYTSYIYLITKKENTLSWNKRIRIEDLKGETLLVGGGSPPQLRALQQKIINTLNIDYLNSENHETTLTNIAAEKAVCLTPGFFNDFTGEFAWTPFVCDEKFECYLCVHTNDKRESLKIFLKILVDIYKEKAEKFDM